jgi:hypothetical protein
MSGFRNTKDLSGILRKLTQRTGKGWSEIAQQKTGKAAPQIDLGRALVVTSADVRSFLRLAAMWNRRRSSSSCEIGDVIFSGHS